MCDNNVEYTIQRDTILCVDDEKNIVDSLYDTFMDYYHVKTATGGKEALRIFEKEKISLVITDQRMPEMTGTELLMHIHEIKPSCKKILLTGYSDMYVAIDAINKAFVDKYIVKPWDDEKLIKEVKELIDRCRFDEFMMEARKSLSKKKSRQSVEIENRDKRIKSMALQIDKLRNENTALKKEVSELLNKLNDTVSCTEDTLKERDKLKTDLEQTRRRLEQIQKQWERYKNYQILNSTH